LEALAFQHHILGVHAAHTPLRVEHAAIWAFGTEAGSEGASKQKQLHRAGRRYDTTLECAF
jgi:hypothetical protein